MSRAFLACSLFALLAVLPGCERVAHAVAALADPDAAFDRSCARLPTTEVTVTAPVPQVRERRDLPQAALEAKHGNAAAGHRTVGLTEVDFHQTLDVRYSGLQDGRGRACVRPRVTVELTLAPLTVLVAREIHGDPCREPLVRAHEQRHVDVYVGYVAEAAPRLQRLLLDQLGTAPHRGTTPEAAQRDVQDRLEAAVSAFMQASARELATRNAAIDTPEEYDALTRACGA